MRSLVGLVQAGLASAANELDALQGHVTRMAEVRASRAEAVGGDDDARDEVSLLVDLEHDVLERVAETRADDLHAVIHKLAIWEIVAEDHDEGQAAENAVVRSALRDLRRLAAGTHAS